MHTFEDYYSSMFTQFEFSKPEPVMDVDFDDFADLNFGLYKDVHIHAMEIYDNGAYLCGLEMYYLVDGDVMRYILHHRTKKGPAVAQKAGGLGLLMMGKKAEVDPL